MSNRTDFTFLARELGEMFDLPPAALERIETELHDAYVAGQEGNGCECQWCMRGRPEDTLTGPRMDAAKAGT